MKKLLMSLCVIGILLGCSGDKAIDVSYVNDGFQGITHMNIFGDPNGPQDSDDWRLFYGTSPFLSSSSGVQIIENNNDEQSEDPLMKIIPSHFELAAAYPNPTNDNFTIGFSTPNQSDVTVSVVDNELHLLYQKSGSFEAGMHAFYISTADFKTFVPPNGIYRVFIDISGGITGYGDVLIVN